MAGDDLEHQEHQERFENYLELERYITELQAEQAAHPPQDLTPGQARIYRMAALLSSAAPDAAEPRPEFAEALRARLLALDTSAPATLQTTAANNGDNTSPQTVPMGTEAIAEIPLCTPGTVKKARFFSRRSLLTGGAVAAASLAVGAGTASLVEHQITTANQTAYPTTELVAGPTTRLFVATLAQLSNHAVKFVADTVVGYVVLNSGSDAGDNTKDAEKVIALSAACTHMGCIVNWENNNRQFRCPCHGGLFDAYGKPAKGSPLAYLTSLPHLKTHVENGNVYVEVPASASTTQKQSW